MMLWQLLSYFSLLALAQSCPTVTVQGGQKTCVQFDLSHLPQKTVLVSDSYPEPYLVGPVCGQASKSSCEACASSTAGGVAYQLEPPNGCSGHRCLSLGHGNATAQAIFGRDKSTVEGVSLTYGGGDGGRAFTFNVLCNASAPASAAPSAVDGTGKGFRYATHFHSPYGCGKAVPGPCGAPQPPAKPMAKPTPAQLQWQTHEIGAIGHFNMGTFEACGIGGTDDSLLNVPDPATFAPTNVNATQWVEALASFGAERAVLVVSHGCGFNTFPSRTRFPEFQFEYNYTVANSPWKNGKGDIAAEFVSACRRFGVKPGFYHGAMNNAFLGVISGRVHTRSAPGNYTPVITQDQYTKILLANLRQLWTDYGELAEVWFDGGFPPGTADLISDLQKELQPNSVGFQGPGLEVIRWAGTEGGHVGEPFWSAAKSSLTAGKGDPFGAVWAPGEADTCFQSGCHHHDAGEEERGPYGGCWFFHDSLCPKPLTELISSYHDTIGHNAYWLLDWTPNQQGVLRKDHIQRYAELGNWLTECYASPAARVTDVKVGAGSVVTLAMPEGRGRALDRIVLRENQTNGQLILGFTVEVKTAETWSQVLSGESIGNRFIGLFRRPQPNATAVRVNLTQVHGPTRLAEVSVFNCSRTPLATGCAYERNFAYKIVPSITIATSAGKSVAGCCALCRAKTQCAVFVLSPSHGTCTLMSANQGGAASAGWVSGVVNR